jgi:hypothetical protein
MCSCNGKKAAVTGRVNQPRKQMVLRLKKKPFEDENVQPEQEVVTDGTFAMEIEVQSDI